MFARLLRTTFASAKRCPPTSVPLSVVRVSRRNMSAASHAPTCKSSDTPWLIGSLVVFGPAFLYLISPSARKNTHGVHDDHRNFPALKQHDAHQEHKSESAVPEVETMKDDDGTEANVTSSIVLSQESDVPNDSTSAESNAQTLAAAKTEEVPLSEESATTPEGTAVGKDGSGTVQEKVEEDPPTDFSKAKKSAQKAAGHKK